MKITAGQVWRLHEIGALEGQRFLCVKEMPVRFTNHTCKGLIGIVADAAPSLTCLRVTVHLKNIFGVKFCVFLKPGELANYFELATP